MFLCCALFLYLWYGTCAVGRDSLTLAFPQLVPPAMACVGRVHVLGADH